MYLSATCHHHNDLLRHPTNFHGKFGDTIANNLLAAARSTEIAVPMVLDELSSSFDSRLVNSETWQGNAPERCVSSS